MVVRRGFGSPCGYLPVFTFQVFWLVSMMMLSHLTMRYQIGTSCWSLWAVLPGLWLHLFLPNLVPRNGGIQQVGFIMGYTWWSSAPAGHMLPQAAGIRDFQRHYFSIPLFLMVAFSKTSLQGSFPCWKILGWGRMTVIGNSELVLGCSTYVTFLRQLDIQKSLSSQ